jgi:hypothetical protein
MNIIKPMKDDIKPGTLVHVGYVGDTKLGIFLTYNEKVDSPTRPLRTCNVLIEEVVTKVLIGLIEPIEEFL